MQIISELENIKHKNQAKLSELKEKLNKISEECNELQKRKKDLDNSSEKTIPNKNSYYIPPPPKFPQKTISQNNSNFIPPPPPPPPAPQQKFIQNESQKKTVSYSYKSNYSPPNKSYSYNTKKDSTFLNNVLFKYDYLYRDFNIKDKKPKYNVCSFNHGVESIAVFGEGKLAVATVRQVSIYSVKFYGHV